MKLISTREFTCYPDGVTPMHVALGAEFEIPDSAYAALLQAKGLAEDGQPETTAREIPTEQDTTI